MYRNFFGSGSSGSKIGEENLRIMTKALVEVNERLIESQAVPE